MELLIFLVTWVLVSVIAKRKNMSGAIAYGGGLLAACIVVIIPEMITGASEAVTEAKKGVTDVVTQAKNEVSEAWLAYKDIAVFLLVVFLALFLPKKGDAKGSTKSSKSDDAWSEKRKSGHMSTYGKHKVKGGMLPREGSIGRIMYRYDKSPARFTGSKGKVKIYKAEGDLQIFVKDRVDVENVEFIGNGVVDYYYG